MTFSELLIIFHIFLCAGLIGLILIQHGKGADAGAAFGSGASATVFGSQGSSSFLSRTTAIMATTFFVTSLTLAYLSGQRIEPKSVVDSVQPVTTTEPAPSSEQDNKELPSEETVPSTNNEVPEILPTDSEIPTPSE